ncbi:MAG: Mammalian cell entry related domain protein [Amycolatopsis sp.]|uniref:MlaD family protein n=1 Tax=Amycolatopsis sp. TaxID=37632 RepID=UPI002603585B|nr:MlaD family protein [Amycolatopsis sp.]MCU1679976.1 Mammalian cell entry related domain protein [Amycolatopsis sp.]
MTERKQRFRRFMDRVKTEPGLKRNVSVLIALIALAGVAGGIILTNQRVNFPWDNKFEFYATFAGSPGVSPDHGQEVRIAGVAVGEIKTADVDNRGMARLELSIDPQYKVYDNATVVLRPKSPLNEMYVELNPGNAAKGHPLAADGVLPVTASQRPIEIDEVLDHLDDNSREALTTLLQESDTALAAAPQNLPQGLTATDQVAQKLQPVLAALNTRRDGIQHLVTALQQISSSVGDDGGRLQSLADSLQTTLSVLGQKSSSLDSVLGQLPDLTTQLKAATDSVGTLSSQLDPALDNLKNASSTLPDALSKLTGTVDQLNTTLDEAKPVVDKAGPVVADLRPYVRDLNVALPDLRVTTTRLDPVTSALVKYLPDLGAFVVNTHSMTSLADANGGILRGMLEITPTTLPLDMSKILPTLTGK